MRPARQCLAAFCAYSKPPLIHLTGGQRIGHLAMAGGFDLLEAFGLDPGIIEILKEKYGPELLLIQKKAFKVYPVKFRRTSEAYFTGEHQILSGGNFIIFAVISTGKNVFLTLIPKSGIVGI